MPVTLDPNATVTPYSSIRAHIERGDILLASGSSAMSRLIRHETKSDWSHVGVIWWWSQRLVVLEAVESHGTRVRRLSWYVDRYPGALVVARHGLQARFYVESPDRWCDDAHRALSWAIDHTGVPYDHAEIARIQTRLVMRRLGLIDEAKRHANDRYICSEYAHEILTRMGIEIEYQPLGIIVPGDFAADAFVQPVATLKLS